MIDPVEKTFRQKINDWGLLKKYSISLLLYLTLTYLIYYSYPNNAANDVRVQELKTWIIIYSYLFNILLGQIFNIKLSWTFLLAFIVWMFQAILTRLILYNAFTVSFYNRLDQSVDLSENNSIFYLTWTFLVVNILQHTIHFIIWTQILKIKKFRSKESE